MRVRAIWLLVVVVGCTPLRALDEPREDARVLDASRADTSIDATPSDAPVADLDAVMLDAPGSDTPGSDAPMMDARASDAAVDAANDARAPVDANAVDAFTPDAFRAPDAGTSLIAWYPFDTTRDATGLGHTLTSVGVTFSGDIAMLAAGAALSTPTATDLDEVTALSLWVRPATIDGEIGSRTTVLQREGQILVLIRFTALPRCTLAGNTVSGSTALVEAEWTHIACVRDATTLTLYTNGIPTGTIAATGVPSPSSSELRLGASSTGTDPLLGDLSDVRLYRRAPTATEISALAADRP